MKLNFGTLVLGLSFLTGSLCDSKANLLKRTAAIQRSSHSSSDGINAESNIPSTQSLAGTSWTPVLTKRSHPGEPWSTEEDERLLRLKKERKPWSEIVPQLPGRTFLAQVKRYFVLTHDPSEKKTKSPKWTDEENEDLLWLMQEGASYDDVADLMPHRSRHAISSHHSYLMRGYPTPTVVNRRFIPEEDELLLELAQTDIPWPERVDFFDDRTLASLQKRYARIRATNVKRPRWTPDEENTLIQAIEADFTWDEIVEMIGRDKKAVKARVKKLAEENRIDPMFVAKGSHYSDSDFERVGDLLEQRVPWNDIAAEHFPGRPLESLKKLYYKYQKKKRNREAKGKRAMALTSTGG